MSKTVVATVAVGIIVALGAAAWWAGIFDDLTSRLDLDILHREEEMTEEEKAVQETPPSSELSTAGDASDESLEQDLSTLDAQMDAYGETSSELDASLADEPVEQDSSF